MLAALNGLKVKTANIDNAYLNAPNKERVHVKCGPELFGPEGEDRIAAIVCALYGLKSAGNAWRHFFSNYITEELKYCSTVADPDVYHKSMPKEDGSKYYAYLVVYVDDVLCCDADLLLQCIKFSLKNKYTDPNLYLGIDI